MQRYRNWIFWVWVWGFFLSVEISLAFQLLVFYVFFLCKTEINCLVSWHLIEDGIFSVHWRDARDQRLPLGHGGAYLFRNVAVLFLVTAQPFGPFSLQKELTIINFFWPYVIVCVCTLFPSELGSQCVSGCVWSHSESAVRVMSLPRVVSFGAVIHLLVPKHPRFPDLIMQANNTWKHHHSWGYLCASPNKYSLWSP